MNLFENLQLMTNNETADKKNESKETLIERKQLSISEYNRLKAALNKNNVMRGNFILHPGEIFEDDYKLKLSVNGAFKNQEHDRDSRYSYNKGYKNDEVTRDGVGIKLYTVHINLIDESIRFTDILDGYRLSSYVSNYEKYLIQNNIVSNKDMDLSSLTQSIVDVAEASKKDLENILRSKNFIYNLTGKRKVQRNDSPEYNLNLENTNLTEDFDPSMPNWLMRAIKVNNASKSNAHKDLNYTMPLDTMQWTVEPFPEKGKLDNVRNDEYIALLVDKSGDAHNGDYIVYFPSAFIGNNETIMINGRNRRIDSMSLRALAPYVKEFAHTVDSTNSVLGVRNKQTDRGIAQDGSINKVSDDDKYMYGWGKIDKSGYVVDPNKYKRLLAQMKSDKYAERLEDMYTVLSDLRTKLKNYLSHDDIVPDAKYNRFGHRDTNINEFNRAYKYYDEAIRYYQWATEELEKISKGEKSRWGNEASETFEINLKNSETNIVNCLNVIEPKK